MIVNVKYKNLFYKIAIESIIERIRSSIDWKCVDLAILKINGKPMLKKFFLILPVG